MAEQQARSQAARRRRLRARDVTLITTARKSPLEDWHSRRRLYAVLQFARLPLLALSGVLMWLTGNVTLSAGVAIASLPLPWVAVLMANEKGDADPRERQVYKPQLVREANAAVALEAASRAQLAAPQGEQADSGTLHPVVIDSTSGTPSTNSSRSARSNPAASPPPPTRSHPATPKSSEEP